MTKRQFWERAYLRACSLPTSGFLSSDFGLQDDEREALGVEQQEVDEALLGLLEIVAEGVQVR